MAKDERQAALDIALKKIEKDFGKGAVMRLGESAQTQISTVSSGSLALDNALGVGGFPRGRIVEIYGPESSGKTTVALHAVAEVQKNGGTAAYIDAENAMDPAYATALGVDIDNLLLSQPDTGEQGLQIADALKVGIVVGNPETTAGGRALKFYSTIRLEVRRAEQIKDGSEAIGNRVKIKVVKNKVAPPFKVAQVDMMYGKGISQTGEIIDMGVDKDIVNKSGSWYSYNNERIGQGRENAKKYLDEHPNIKSEIRQKVRAAYGMDEASENQKESASATKKKKEPSPLTNKTATPEES